MSGEQFVPIGIPTIPNTRESYLFIGLLEL